MDRSFASRGRTPINTLMRAFVAELATAGVPDPLVQELTFAAVCDDLCRLAGEVTPPFVACLLGGAAPGECTRGPLAIAGPIAALCARLLTELRAGAIGRPLAEPLAVGLVWADLCRLAGEEPPAAVRALLDAPVRC